VKYSIYHLLLQIKYIPRLYLGDYSLSFSNLHSMCYAGME